MSERRKARRYNVALPMNIRASVDNDLAPVHGETIDISTHGVLFAVCNDLRVGTALTLHISVPAELVGGTEMRILAIGRVVRVEKPGEDGAQNVRAAAAIKKYKYFRNRITNNSAQSLTPLGRNFAQ